jgi:hypothetical protein
MRVRSRDRLEHIGSNLNPQSAFKRITLTMAEPDDKPPKIKPTLNLDAATACMPHFRSRWHNRNGVRFGTNVQR